MTETTLDSELVSAYAAKGSEPAFGALVRRHVDLVFATALRLTGDASLAEEVTQNVFITLARKAPGLAGHETLAGWLHRATVLETKARVRSELRRRQREQSAFEMSHIEREGTSPFAVLLPLLDEALLHLRETDRLALVTRYLEEKSLREVGEILGVEEDTARKRVSRALDRLGDFYRLRGFSLAAGGAAALLATTTQAAPATLVGKVAAAAASAGNAGGLVNSLVLHFMKLTKTQTATACVLLAAVPLVWQHFTSTALAAQTAALGPQVAQARRQAEGLEAETARLLGAVEKSRSAASNSSLALNTLRAQLADASARPRYRWDNGSPYARMPKSALSHGHGLRAFQTRRGELTEQITQLLQMTGTEKSQTDGAVQELLGQYYALEAAGMKQVQPNASDLNGHPADQTRVFDVPYIGGDQMAELQQNFYSQINSILGDERGLMFSNAVSWFMPPPGTRGISSAETVYNSGYRIRFYAPGQGASGIPFSIVLSGHAASASGELPAGEVPDLFASYLQDWTGALQNQAQ